VKPDDEGTSNIEFFQYRDYLAKDVAVGLYGSNVVTKKSVVEQAGGLRHSTPTTFCMDLLDTMLRIGVYGPCVVVKRPTTVSYRVHQGNSVRDIERMTNGIYPSHPRLVLVQVRAGGSSTAYCVQISGALHSDVHRRGSKENSGTRTRALPPRVRPSCVGNETQGNRDQEKP